MLAAPRLSRGAAAVAVDDLSQQATSEFDAVFRERLTVVPLYSAPPVQA